ncbi:MAG: ATP-binding protein [Anaerolineales bacterium]|nr:ATP-binding protein [Anaerolineales bacterium]
MTKNQVNPYIYGPPARGKSFINRESELQTLFNRLRTGQSTAIIGEPHVGKTSLLLKMDEPETQAHYLTEDEIGRIQVRFLNLHRPESKENPATFWQRALRELREKPGNRLVSARLKAAETAQYDQDSLESLFETLAEHGRKLVLLLDEFEGLLIHPGFKDPAFFASLRSLSNNTGGLVLILASRKTVEEMNELGYGLLASGSPLFNNNISVFLRPFDTLAVETLLNFAGDQFSSKERQFVRRVAGNNPFLLQAMAGTLWETTGSDRHIRAAEMFFERVSFQYKDLWDSFDDATRTTSVILSLLELGGRALGREFNYGEVERVDAFGPELRKLARRGLAECLEKNEKGWIFDWEHWLVWRGERWTVSSQAFVWWVRDMAIAQTRQIPKYDEWLANQRYRGLFTEKQWNDLHAHFKRLPPSALYGVAELANALWTQIK